MKNLIKFITIFLLLSGSSFAGNRFEPEMVSRYTVPMYHMMDYIDSLMVGRLGDDRVIRMTYYPNRSRSIKTSVDFIIYDEKRISDYKIKVFTYQENDSDILREFTFSDKDRALWTILDATNIHGSFDDGGDVYGMFEVIMKRY